jgi:hypothetical protein
MKVEKVIAEIQKLVDLDREIVVEINGRTDHIIKEIYVDGSGKICIAIELDEDYKKFL